MASKKCGDCHLEKPVDEFAFKNKITGLRQSRCKPCMRIYQKAHYENNKRAYIDKAKVSNAAAKSRLTVLRDAFLQGKCCSVCSRTEDLTFYQRPGSGAERVHEVVRGRGSPERLQKAMEASYVMCNTCLNRLYAPYLAPYQFAEGGLRRKDVSCAA